MRAGPDFALEIRRATTDDLDDVVGLLHAAYRRLIDQGVTDQWIEPFPPDSIRRLIARGEVYIAAAHDKPIATFTLTFEPDPELWGQPPGDAGYIRRLVVDRRFAGRELGAQLLDHAAYLVASTGRDWLRLDCAKNNTRLHAYYRERGFTYLRTVDLPHRQSGALFAREARARPSLRPRPRARSNNGARRNRADTTDFRTTRPSTPRPEDPDAVLT